MDENPLAQLSEAQRTCLRLVALNRSSKEIAQETGLSHQTVDQYISRAATTLGASNRREAARMLGELEVATFNKSEFKPEAIAAAEKSLTIGMPGGNGDFRGRRAVLSKWVPAIGGTRHDLTPADTISTILRISLFTMGTAGAIIAIVFWLNRLML